MNSAQFVNLREVIRELIDSDGEDGVLFQISDEGDSITLETDTNSIVLYSDGTYSTYEIEENDDVV